jgi:tRNA modification GTPase
MTITDTDTICAIATPIGRSGVGIIRISGPDCGQIASRLLGFDPEPRKAYFTEFYNKDSETIDKGIALFFRSPNSFTGEDVLELQGHGGIFILNGILKAALGFGCRLARPGEFSERAFLNNKLDLIQVEAIADLINANTEQAARSAFRTLEGEFSRRIDQLVAATTELRVYLEAAIDFTDEDIDFISEGNIDDRLQQIIVQLTDVFRQARLGTILQEGISVAIAGRPNAGKSSLLNALSGKDSAIVTDIPGTTRDPLRELVDLDGIPVHIIDTAGLRSSDDIVEQEGVRRARLAIEKADLILLVVDSQVLNRSGESLLQLFQDTGLPLSVLDSGKLLVVFNKSDLLGSIRSTASSELVSINQHDLPAVSVSARTASGIDRLRDQLKQMVGFNTSEEGSFIARERHMQALERARESLERALAQLQEGASLELTAEDLRYAQNFLGEITGQHTTDDLLGQIFASFCIGK